LQAVRVIHRVGDLSPGDPIVRVLVASAHRRDAFEACDFIMDYLKTQAPFWKKEHSKQGAYWVKERHTDQQDAERW
ncbi:MAG TPA: molybdenum cofactor biosynthesis protein E, partial [Halomonas sp.]|nr:molybdenum cofactor biosynthesis protein E [Halomonas sp.]